MVKIQINDRYSAYPFRAFSVSGAEVSLLQLSDSQDDIVDIAEASRTRFRGVMATAVPKDGDVGESIP